MSEDSDYKEIFKSTILFSIVKVISITVRIIINKAVAVLLGTQGMGMIGMFYSSTDIIRAVCGLGISQSAVRDVSTAYANNNREKFSLSIFITRRIIIITGLLGALVTILLSPLLSKWSFGSYDQTIAYVFLGIFTFASIVNEGQTAIIRGVRNLRALAKATIFGALTGLVLGVPLYYFWGKNGIVPSMIVVSLSSLGFSWWLVTRIDYEKLKISIAETIKGGSEMIKLGIALTYISFLGLLSDFLIRAYIAEHGSLDQVGIFQAGAVLLSSYFGIVLTALNTDYYPRMFAVANDINELKKQMNMQVNAAFLMLTPILSIFIIFMPIIIELLYTIKFIEVINYLQFAIFALLIDVFAATLGVVLIAKQESKLVAISVTAFRFASLPILILGYTIGGLKGLGVAAIFSSLIHVGIVGMIVYKKFNIFYTRSTNTSIFILITITATMILISHISNQVLNYAINTLVFAVLIYYSNHLLKKSMNINLLSYILRKLKNKTNEN